MRKKWIMKYDKDEPVDNPSGDMTYTEFIRDELVCFSVASCARAIPCLDGFKTSQRKVLYASLKKKLHTSIKVSQLAGYVSEQTSYHHGEMSLTGCITNMAQNYVGSNNINLLFPDGQFGTRLQGGKDAASPRYIFTRMETITEILFNKFDNTLLEY